MSSWRIIGGESLAFGLKSTEHLVDTDDIDFACDLSRLKRELTELKALRAEVIELRNYKRRLEHAVDDIKEGI